MLTTIFFVTACLAGSGAGGGMAASAMANRRRFSEEQLGPQYHEHEMMAASDAELCGKVHEYLETPFFLDLLSEYHAMTDADRAKEAKVTMADKIQAWCQERAGSSGDDEKRRRAEGVGAGAWNDYAKSVTDDMTEIGMDVQGAEVHGSEAYLNSMRRFSESDEFMARRRVDSTVDLLPAGEYKQCAAYSYFTAQLIENLADNGAAEMILKPEGKLEGCGAIVNSVNEALKSDGLPHVQVINLNGRDVAVTNDPEVAEKLKLNELHAIYHHKVEWWTEEEENQSVGETSLTVPEAPLRRLAQATAAGTTFVVLTLCQSYAALAAGTAAGVAYKALA